MVANHRGRFLVSGSIQFEDAPIVEYDGKSLRFEGGAALLKSKVHVATDGSGVCAHIVLFAGVTTRIDQVTRPSAGKAQGGQENQQTEKTHDSAPCVA